MAASVQQWFPFSLEPAVEQVIRQVDFSWCLEDPVVAELPGDAPFWIVRREKLDQLLAEQAISAGGERLGGVEVNGIRRSGGGSNFETLYLPGVNLRLIAEEERLKIGGGTWPDGTSKRHPPKWVIDLGVKDRSKSIAQYKGPRGCGDRIAIEVVR